MTNLELVKSLKEATVNFDEFATFALAELAAFRIWELSQLLDEMSLLLRVADFEDLGDYHASLDVLSKYKEISND